MTDDAALLHRYAHDRDETAFKELVHRHVDVVYAAALRQCHGRTAAAEDITQQVFTHLALQANRFSDHPALVGWLHTATRFTAMKLFRAEARRQQREQAAANLAVTAGNEASVDWDRALPLLDDTLAKLKDRERAAVLLRFFERRSFKEVGACLQLTETAARSCVDRALERMRQQLTRRGVVSTVAAIDSALTLHAATAAPAGLAGSVSSTAVVASAAKGSVLLATLAMKKIVLAAVILLAATEFATATVALRSRSELRAACDTARSENTTLIRAASRLTAASTSPAPAPEAASVGAAELAQLQHRIAQLKARPPGIVDSEMRPPQNRGRATPEDFANTIAWSTGAGGVDLITPYLVLAQNTPENRAAFMAHFSPAVRIRYPTPEQLIIATQMADSLADPVVAMQLTSAETDYQGTTIVKAWDRRASGRERMDFLPLTQTAQGWGLGPIPLSAEYAQQLLSTIDPAAGDPIKVSPPEIHP